MSTGVVDQRIHVAGGGNGHHQSDPRGQGSNDKGGRHGFAGEGLDLLPQQLARAEHDGEVVQRFGEVAAGLLLDREHDGEEPHLRRGHAVIHLLEGLIDGGADGDALHQFLELLGQRLRAFCGDQTHAVMHRQTGLDAPYDDVDGVGEFLGEFLGATLGQCGQQPARDAKPAGEPDADGGQDGRPKQQGHHDRDHADDP